jgi:trk system potassium uptake protein TrkA
MAHQVAVVGMGRFGMTLSQELYRIGHDVLVVDKDEALTQAMMGHVTYAVTGDCTSGELFEEIGISNFDTAVVAIGTDIQSSVLTTVLLKQQFNVPQVIARATNELHGRTLHAIGADRVVYPEQETGTRVAHSLFQREVLEYMELTDEFGFSKINATPELIGQTIEQAGLAGPNDRYGVSVVAIKRGRNPILAPAKDERIQPDDVLVVAGTEEILEQFRRRQ